MTELTDDQRDALKKVEKLFRLAGGTTSQAERDSALEKGNAILLAYNLSAAELGGADEGRRAQEKLSGGFYEYERDLMSRIADVNFCLHWTSRDWVERPEHERRHQKVLVMRSRWQREHIRRFRHHLVGRAINVMACQQMYAYILQTTERLTRDFVGMGLPTTAEGSVVGLGAALRSARAVNFREGVVSSVVTKLWERRQDQIARERAAARAAEELAARAAAGPASSSTTLAISSYKQSEEDANYDLLYGEGWSAKERAERAARAKARADADAAYTLWAAAHPEEAAAQERERRAEERKSSRRRGGGPGSRGGSGGREKDWGAWDAGQKAGRDVGLEPQAEHSSAPRKIAGRV